MTCVTCFLLSYQPIRLYRKFTFLAAYRYPSQFFRVIFKVRTSICVLLVATKTRREGETKKVSEGASLLMDTFHVFVLFSERRQLLLITNINYYYY